jgi:peptidoglycan/xylan/chitin deacetylase (PgdA/CDA1 family)
MKNHTSRRAFLQTVCLGSVDAYAAGENILAADTAKLDEKPMSAQWETRDGGILRGPKDRHAIALAFTAHEFWEGATTILDALASHRAKASFFVTGDFLEMPQVAALIRRIIKDEHYLGPHSDRHLLYCAWDTDKRTLVSREAFRQDLDANLKKIERFGVSRQQVRYFVPPYEHYNLEIARWSKEMGLSLVNPTPGLLAPADYTAEGDPNFVSSQRIFDSITVKRRNDPNGLNGAVLLMHLGAGAKRKDKLHNRLSELLDNLSQKGYRFVRVDELLKK